MANKIRRRNMKMELFGYQISYYLNKEGMLL
jgi:hypothetical protein